MKAKKVYKERKIALRNADRMFFLGGGERERGRKVNEDDREMEEKKRKERISLGRRN